MKHTPEWWDRFYGRTDADLDMDREGQLRADWEKEQAEAREDAGLLEEEER